jgi:hypothetical protein
MDMKSEGPAFPPVPLVRGPMSEAARHGARLARESTDPRCEMCGSTIIASHCKRICLRCGFMTGCSEGI